MSAPIRPEPPVNLTTTTTPAVQATTVPPPQQAVSTAVATGGFDFMAWFMANLWQIVGGIIVVAVGVLIAVLVVSKRRTSKARRRLEFYQDLSNVLKLGPDAVAVAFDADTGDIYYLPLYWQGGYYTFKDPQGNTGIFVPTLGRAGRCKGRPCFVAVKSGSTLIERDLMMAVRMNILASTDKEFRDAVESPFPEALEKMARIASQRGGSSPTSIVPLFDATPTRAEIDFSSFMSKTSDGLLTALKSLTNVMIETGGALERKAVAEGLLATLMKYFPWVAVGVAIILLFLALAGHMAPAFPPR